MQSPEVKCPWCQCSQEPELAEDGKTEFLQDDEARYECVQCGRMFTLRIIYETRRD